MDAKKYKEKEAFFKSFDEVVNNPFDTHVLELTAAGVTKPVSYTHLESADVSRRAEVAMERGHTSVSYTHLHATVTLYKKGVVDLATFIIFALVFLVLMFTSISPIPVVVTSAILGILLHGRKDKQ